MKTDEGAGLRAVRMQVDVQEMSVWRSDVSSGNRDLSSNMPINDTQDGRTLLDRMYFGCTSRDLAGTNSAQPRNRHIPSRVTQRRLLSQETDVRSGALVGLSCLLCRCGKYPQFRTSRVAVAARDMQAHKGVRNNDGWQRPSSARPIDNGRGYTSSRPDGQDWWRL